MLTLPWQRQHHSVISTTEIRKPAPATAALNGDSGNFVAHKVRGIASERGKVFTTGKVFETEGARVSCASPPGRARPGLVLLGVMPPTARALAPPRRGKEMSRQGDEIRTLLLSG